MEPTIDITPVEAEALVLYLNRLTYDHALSCTDGTEGEL